MQGSYQYSSGHGSPVSGMAAGVGGYPPHQGLQQKEGKWNAAPQPSKQKKPLQRQQPQKQQQGPGRAAPAPQEEQNTTVMLRNLPVGYARETLMEKLNGAGFHSEYDFVYMPMNFRAKSTFGYAFVNFCTPGAAARSRATFTGFKDWGPDCEKASEVSWSDMHQGLKAHVERYRNSPVMHQSVPDEYKPVMLAHGVRVPFPPPTKRIRMPRIRRAQDGEGEDEGPEFDEGPEAPEDGAAMQGQEWTL